MKILHVYKDYYPIMGGIENHIKLLAEAQVKSGHDVSVLVTNPGKLPEEEIHDGVRIMRASRIATILSTPISLSLPILLKKQNPDITHLHFPYPLGEISQLLVGRQRPYILTYQADIANPNQQAILRFYQPFLHLMLQNARAIIATSANYLEMSEYLQRFEEKCKIISLGVDPAPFLAAAPTIPTLNQSNPTILFLGRHRYYKGVGYLIEAMQDIPARLLIGGDGPLRLAWESLSRELGLSEKITFLGDIPQRNLASLYARADVFVLPAISRAEAYGMVLLEAMASGLPCVTTELGTGTSCVVQDGITGFVVPPKNPAALAKAIMEILSNQSLHHKMGETGRNSVLESFNITHIKDQVLDTYQQVLSEKTYR